MVRVTSIYHFASQSIQQLATQEVISASCLIPSDSLVLAKNSDHTIEIRQLSENSSEKTFASVDDVQQIFYSQFGHFLLTVESRISNYERAEIRYVRIYVNWDTVTHSSQGQALRARIAGKITPMKKSLEMIELPLSYNPSLVAFCHSTGNIIVGHKNILQLFFFKYCTNETTKLQYVDFFPAPFQIELDFQPQRVLFTENILTCMSATYVHVFKVISRDESHSSTLSESQLCTSTEVVEERSNMKINLSYDVDFEAIKDKKELNGNIFKVDIKSTQEEILEYDECEMKPLIVNELNVNIKYTGNTQQVRNDFILI